MFDPGNTAILIFFYEIITRLLFRSVSDEQGRDTWFYDYYYSNLWSVVGHREGDAQLSQLSRHKNQVQPNRSQATNYVSRGK